MNGRDVARLLSALVAAELVSGCESVFHMCMNGVYGAPYYDKYIHEVAATSTATNPIDPDRCPALCESPAADHCEYASFGDQANASHTYVVCFAYRENGCPSGWGSGRVPEGLALDPRSATTIGEYFSRAAALEAASVVSFRRLARELAVHGAPGELVVRAEAAADEERKHALLARKLAHRFDGGRTRARVERMTRTRSILELAVENTWSGCVGETLGALLLAARARVSVDAETRAALEEMARDEIGHAALAWDVREFLRRRLDDGGRATEASALADAARAARRLTLDPVFPFDPRPLVDALDVRVFRAA